MNATRSRPRFVQGRTPKELTGRRSIITNYQCSYWLDLEQKPKMQRRQVVSFRHRCSLDAIIMSSFMGAISRKMGGLGLTKVNSSSISEKTKKRVSWCMVDNRKSNLVTDAQGAEERRGGNTSLYVGGRCCTSLFLCDLYLASGHLRCSLCLLG